MVGRGIRLPDRIYDYFYEQFIDPTGVMTSPSGRGKGKTSQVPKVYKIKPEYPFHVVKKNHFRFGIKTARHVNFGSIEKHNSRLVLFDLHVLQ